MEVSVHNDLQIVSTTRKWFAEYDAALWDRGFEADVAEGRFDAIARDVLKDHKAGKTTAR